jgi:hypothetical protein
MRIFLQFERGHVCKYLQLAVNRIVHVMVHIIVAPSCSVLEEVLVIASLPLLFLLKTHVGPQSLVSE